MILAFSATRIYSLQSNKRLFQVFLRPNANSGKDTGNIDHSILPWTWLGREGGINWEEMYIRIIFHTEVVR
jgi:hypothetical protein